MIEGLWIEMSSDKLRSLFNVRVGYHRDKAAWYKIQADEIEVHAKDMPASNNPVQSLRSSQREHENKAAFFGVLAENLIANETYRLSEQNCMRIELYSQYF
jgi:hypothetical protein